ncbi:MAG: hypothetical protein AAF288_08650 [Planctomycetota bacterium]
MLTLPDLFAGATPSVQTYYDWVFWPLVSLEILLMALVAIGLWYEADLKGVAWLRWAVVALAPVVIGSMVGWWFFPVTSNATLVASYFVYVIPVFYMAAINAGAASELA